VTDSLLHSNPIEKQDELSRAVLYNLFACILSRKIDQTWLDEHFQTQLQFGFPESEGKEQLLNSLKKALKSKEYYEEIQFDYDQLFIIPGPNLTFPYESCYTYRNIDGTFGRLWQEPAQDMQRILREWNIQFAEGWDMIPDHIAVELFFMAELCKLSTEAIGEEQPVVHEWQVNFFKAHLRVWVFEFLDRLETKAESDFYRGGAKLLREFLREEEAELLDGFSEL
jgi:TorA maturation chaperone TorD